MLRAKAENVKRPHGRLTDSALLTGLLAHTTPLVLAATPALPAAYGRCVYASRTGYDLLARYGIRSEPLATIVTRANAQAVAWWQAGRPVERDPRA